MVFSEEKISVIVPVFNVEEFLERCLLSICNQSYCNLEIILVDDGSTDDSLKVCKEFEQKDKRIKVRTQHNQGVSAARNTGIDLATGDYIAFVDSDDYIHPEMYERLHSILKRNLADVAACFARGCWDSDYIEPPRNDIKIRVYDQLGAIKTIFDPEYAINGAGVVVTNKLYKKSIFDDLHFDTQIRRCEDEQIICYIMQKVNKFAITDERLYYYYHHPNSIVHKKTNEREQVKNYFDLVKIYDERLSLFNKPKYREIYNICLSNVMNIIISAFFNMDDEKFKKSLVKKYSYYYNKLMLKTIGSISAKDLARLSSFRIHPRMYKMILFSSKKYNSNVKT